MKVHLRYFASLREALGPGEAVEVPAGLTLAQLRRHLQGRDAVHAEALGAQRALRVALNQSLCGEQTLVEDGAEVAFFPPVTGG